MLAKIDPGLGVACLLTLFAFYPLLQPGLPNTADGALHLYRTVELDQCWQDGVYYRSMLAKWSLRPPLGS